MQHTTSMLDTMSTMTNNNTTLNSSQHTMDNQPFTMNLEQHHYQQQQQQQQQTGAVQQYHPLKYGWVFWFMHRSRGEKITDYEAAMKRIASFKTVEEFWAVYSRLSRPSELPNISDYSLFKDGVRPVWEDNVNINGGKWIVRIKKGLASRYWESLVLAIIGDQFDVEDEICGLVLSIRGSEDIISVWNKTSSNGKINLKIRDTIKKYLNLPPDTTMEYKTHNDALRDNSSFRNTDVFR
ncbi:translation initiation factor eIF 4e-like domain-containing protein [Mycotypha africana]|uniref:translation initiation factor eIF 4e-like domain-containing protein n=1 Tax=Mycotypha africana TaxID=64632 RepID=UPI0022FFEB9B|nr:translation initiation factor eIF 4e-like domain-containing protein [Mycotypha africana]KAI8967950.1 translation initiation factor eIF 4e-like domain-containing protein [Mycotypha africana]